MEHLKEDAAQLETNLIETNLTNSLKALGSFKLGTQHYLIVAPDQVTESEVLCQFGVPSGKDEQILAIVEAPKSDLDPTQLLTQREFEIVRLVAHGWVNKQIAQALKISQWTVSTHLRRIFLKLEVETRAAMVYRCAVFL